jgi:hypothetical protein
MADKRLKLEITAKDKTKAAFRTVSQGLSKLGSVAKGLSVAIGLSSIAAGVLIKKMADSIDETGKMSRVLGVTIKNLETFKLAADLGGTSMETFTKGAKQLSVASLDFVSKGTGAAADSFRILGISVQELKPLLNDQVGLMGLVADRFNALPEGALKTATAYKLFGSRGTALINVLEGGSEALQQIAKDTERFGLVLSRDQVLAVEKANDEFTKLFSVATGLTKQITGELFPALGEIARQLRETVLVAIEDSFGSVRDFAKVISEKVTDFTKGASLGLVKAAQTISVGFVKFAKFGIDFLSGFISAVQSLIKSMRPLIEALNDIKGKGIIGFIRGGGDSEPDRSPFGQAIADFRKDHPLPPTEKQLLQAETAKRFDTSQSALEKVQKTLKGTKGILESTIESMDGFFNRTTKWVEDFTLVETKADEVGEKMQETMLETNEIFKETESEVSAIENALKRVENAAGRAGDIIAQGFEDAVFKAKSFEEALGSIADQLLKLVFQQTVTQPLSAAISSGITSFFAPAPSLPAAPAGVGDFNFGANDFSAIAGSGAIMRFGHLEKFARGGVVSRPTKFPLSGGRTGLMGEAGEEAILPLQRGRNGQLGVVAVGGGSRSAPAIVNVNVVDQRKGGEKPEVTENTDGDGNRQISVLIRDEVKRGFAEGAFDRNLKVFGLNRGGIGRV